MHLDYIYEYLFVSYNTTTNRDNYMYNKKWYFIYLKYKRCFNRPRCDFSSLFLKYMFFLLLLRIYYLNDLLVKLKYLIKQS